MTPHSAACRNPPCRRDWKRLENQSMANVDERPAGRANARRHRCVLRMAPTRPAPVPSRSAEYVLPIFLS
jgi:hypothetical protein